MMGEQIFVQEPGPLVLRGADCYAEYWAREESERREM
jgi:hypothetical protein